MTTPPGSIPGSDDPNGGSLPERPQEEPAATTEPVPTPGPAPAPGPALAAGSFGPGSGWGPPGQRHYGLPGQPAYGVPGPPPYGVPGPPPYGVPGPPLYGAPGQAHHGVPGPPRYGVPGQPPYGVAGQPPYALPGQSGQFPYAGPGSYPYGPPSPAGAVPPPASPPPPLFGVAPVPGGAADPYAVPARAGRRRALLVLGGVLTVLLLVGSVSVLAALARGSATGTVTEFLTALQKKDVQKAHDMLCSSGKRQETIQDLRTDFDLDNRTITAHDITGTRERTRDGAAEIMVSVTVSYNTGDPLKLDIGVWKRSNRKICSLQPQGG